MTALLSVDDRPALIPGGGGLEILPPADDAPTLVTSPVVPVQVAPPVTAAPVLILPASGPAGHDGANGLDGAPGAAEVPDLIDLTTLFENGLL